MHMNRAKRVAVLAVTGAALVGAISPAFGVTLERSRTGVHAWSKGTNGAIAVKDTDADSSGSGTTVYSGMDTANYVKALHACVAINFAPDDCTSWAGDH